ncbi:MAG TPA: hypothetical protein ENO20_07045 [Bacteroides sp.]|nr:hypothetical protein [Bacteroides sp.]
MKYISAFLLPFFPAIFLSCNTKQPTVHQWRGPERSGIYAESGLLKQWPGEGPEEAWYAEGIGNGFGSPVIAGDQLYVTGEIDSMAVLHRFDLEGNSIWRTQLGKEWVTAFPGSRSAPTVIGGLIYAGTGMGDLYCVEQENGHIRWSAIFRDDFNGISPLHGHSEAPVVFENRVFWTPGGEIHNVVALDRYTGEMLWSNPGLGERSGYNQPGLIKLRGRNLFVTFSAYHLMGFDAATGDLLWSHEQESYPPEQREPGYGDTHANTVVYSDGSIYYEAGDGNGGVRLDLTGDGSEITEVWRNPGFDGFMGGIVKIGRVLYGGTTTKKTLVSLDISSGQILDSLKAGSGAVIAADDMLYYYNQRGELKLVSYDDEGKLNEVSSFRVTRGTGQHFSHPVIHRGILYLRHGDALMGYQIGSTYSISF